MLSAQFYNRVSFKSCFLLAICIFLVNACNRKTPDHQEDQGRRVIATIEVTGLEDSITGNTLQTVTYKWFFSENVTDKFMAKVHFINDDNRILFQDDHALPSLESSQVYARDLLVPLIPRPQNVRMFIGLYLRDSQEKIVIPDQTGLFRNKIEAKSFKVTPPLYVDDLPEARIIFGDGWYQKEFSRNQSDSWRWIGRQAQCKLKGADRDLILFIHGWAPEDKFGNKLALTLNFKGEDVGIYKDLSGEFIIKREFLKDEIMPGETEDLIITASDSFRPSEYEDTQDTREMSVMIKKIYFN